MRYLLIFNFLLTLPCYSQVTDTLSGHITSNKILHCDTTYILDKGVFIDSGYTLTIKPGVIIKGMPGIGSAASFLVISRGATINALGNAASPIIFTSTQDNITTQDPAYPGLVNLGSTDIGLWGGLVICGRAQISSTTGVTGQIEGIPASNLAGTFGGNNNSDNSGILKYVSIRHGGAHIGQGNEMAGLSLCAVGNQTVVEHIETFAQQDDGIEIFGGTVNLSNVITVRAEDDGIDTDNGYSGTISNFIIYDANDASMELDGPEAADLGLGNHQLKRGTVFTVDGRELCDMDADSNADLDSIYWFGLNPGDYSLKTFTEIPFPVVPSSLSNLEATIPMGESIADYFLNGSDQYVSDVPLGTQTVGANICMFTSWTAFDLSGMVTTNFVVNPTGCNDQSASNYCSYGSSQVNCSYDLLSSCQVSAGLFEADVIGDLDITLFPIPVNDQLNISLASDQWLFANYSVLDLSGRIIIEGEVVSKETILNTQDWSKGMYMLQLSKEEQTFTRRFLTE